MSDNKLFTIAGITTHRGADARGNVSERTKVRYGTDMIRLVKMLNNPKKIEDKRLGICLAPVRVDLVELPRGLTKLDALVHLSGAPEFQSPADQFVIQSELADRTKEALKAARRTTLTVAGGKPAVAVAAVPVA